jgi:hypothetical protein
MANVEQVSTFVALCVCGSSRITLSHHPHVMPPEFIFPGHVLDPKAKRRTERAILFAYSHISNSRNIESPWYAVWNRVLADLIADHSRLLTVPQLVLWYIDPVPDRADRDHSQDSVEDEEAGNTTIDSITSFASTVPEKSARELIPDFAIVRTMTRRTVTPRKLRYAGVPLLVEVKRCPRRVENSRDPGFAFSRALAQHILFAETDVTKQAEYLFRNYPRQETVVLIACSGLWWSCRLIHQDQLNDPSNGIPKHANKYEEDDESDVEEDSLDDEEVEGDTSEDELDVIDAPEGVAFGESEAALPENAFSRVLQLGTRASDQRFGLIHQRLEVVLDSRTGKMG